MPEAYIDRLLACKLLYVHAIPKTINTAGLCIYYSKVADLRTAVIAYPAAAVVAALKKLKSRFTEVAAKKCLSKLANAPPSRMWNCWWDSLIDSEVVQRLVHNTATQGTDTVYYKLK